MTEDLPTVTCRVSPTDLHLVETYLGLLELKPFDMSVEPADRLEAARLEKLHKIEALGIDPWGQRFDDHVAIRDARAVCPTEKGVIGPATRIAGRVMLKNDKGKLKFMHVQDWTGRIQVMLSKADFSDEQWEL